jgi:hypothetical protein
VNSETIQLTDIEIDRLRSCPGGPIRKQVWLALGMPESMHACRPGWMMILRGKVFVRSKYDEAYKIAHLPKRKYVRGGEAVGQLALL